MVRKTLLNEGDFHEMLSRIRSLSRESTPRWGSMNVSQMVSHCNKVMQVATGELILPETNWMIRTVGVLTKKEMWLFNNGIPPYMPTFEAVKENSSCNLEECRQSLITTMDKFLLVERNGQLPQKHPLFGAMSHKDWGFLEYKHINHHLKQFGQ